ncbi:MAG: V-type ATPase 116kDa subunit family protein [Phycisphaerales bacterium]
MIFTSRMVQLFAVVLRKDCERVTEALLREGVMQFIRTSEISAEAQNVVSVSAGAQASLTEISDLRKRIEGLLHTVGVIPSPPSQVDLSRRVVVDMEKEKNRLAQIDGERAGIRDKQRVIQQEVLKLEDIRRQVVLYGAGLSDITASAPQSFIVMQTGKIAASNERKFEEELRDFPSVSIPVGRERDTIHYLLIFMKRDVEKVQRILDGAGWAPIELPDELKSVKEDAFKELSAKLKTLGDEQKKLETEADDLVKREVTRLLDVWGNLRVRELLHRIQTHFTSLARTIVFTGWLPAEKQDWLTEAIRRASEGRCYLEWNEASGKDALGDEVPVRLNNPRVLAPFQMLVSNFGVPRYGTVDPTPFVMPLYLAMFGLMFADVGQGLVLVVLGVLGVLLPRIRAAGKGWHQLSWLIIWCGLSSVFFGVLFGSFFGVMLFKPLWFDFHGIIAGHRPEGAVVSDVFDILAITIYFGISVIGIGLLFNWVNIIRTGKWTELIFDKGGVLGAWIYAGGIYIAFYLVSRDYGEFPSGGRLFFLVGLPSLLLFLKEPYHYFHREGESSAPKTNPVFAALTAVMHWIVELLEIFSGYLSNTLSFMRVAGLGIAHVCLMISFFALAEMTSGIASILILIVGNILVIALEGLSAGIQALRLSYYEFFTKFFHGTGKLYTPISLDSEW